MNATQTSRDIVLEPADNQRLANLCGQFDEHLRQIETRLGVEIASRGNHFRVTGRPVDAEIGGDVLESLFELTDRERLDPERVHIHLQESVMKQEPAVSNEQSSPKSGGSSSVVDIVIQTSRKQIHPRGENQKNYVRFVSRSR